MGLGINYCRTKIKAAAGHCDFSCSSYAFRWKQVVDLFYVQSCLVGICRDVRMEWIKKCVLIPRGGRVQRHRYAPPFHSEKIPPHVGFFYESPTVCTSCLDQIENAAPSIKATRIQYTGRPVCHRTSKQAIIINIARSNCYRIVYAKKSTSRD
jgi:hypothetical protein